MKNRTKSKSLKLDKLSISKLTNSESIIGGIGNMLDDGTEDRTEDKCKNLSIIIR